MFARRAFISFLIVMACSFPASAQSADGWRPIEPAHLTLKASTVEKDADAEALFWDVAVEKWDEKAELRHYVRIKIFTDRGRDLHSTISLDYENGTGISDIAGRTIRPDGTIVPLNPGDIFDKELSRIGKRKTRAKTFAMPAVEVGSIIEYRWRETQKDAWIVALDFQFDLPAQSVTCTIKDSGSILARVLPMNMTDVTLKGEEKQKLLTARRMNVPAFRPEPQMPPEAEVRAWMLLYHVSSFSEYRYWEFLGRDLYEAARGSLKPNDEVKRTVETLLAGATTPEQKLERIYDFCRTRIRNIRSDATLTDEARKRIASTKSPADTLKRESGTGEQINFLFGAMAAAAGFEARYAKTGDRSERFVDVKSPISTPLTSYHIAVQLDGKWRFFDPAGTWLPFGMLRWQEEGMPSLVTDPLSSRFALTAVSGPEKSKRLRRGQFRLNDDGSLEGVVRIEYTGQIGAEWKEWMNDVSAEEREKTLREGVRQGMPTAEVSEVRFENASDPLRNLVCHYRVRVPDYAARTGKRLLLQPAFFQFGAKMLFPNQERRHPIYFHYPWSEEDEVTMELPVGFEPESVIAPPALKLDVVAEYGATMQFMVESRTLIHKRRFSFGAGGALLFPQSQDPRRVAEVYPLIKKFFEIVYDRDNTPVSLKLSVVAAK